MEEEHNIEELTVRYLQQEIKEGELRALDAWLQQSPENKTLFFGLKYIYDTGKYAHCSDSTDIGWQRMYARLRREQPAISPSFTKKKGGWHSVFKCVALITLTVSIGWGASELRNNTTRLKEKIVQTSLTYNEIKVAKGGRANTLLLTDGTKVILNAASVFKYPTDFSAEKREVYLDGEAYFEVAKDLSKPFVIKLRKQRITVLGTSFNVAAYSEEPYSMTTLVNGGISLETFNEKGESMSCMFLKPNQQALSDNQTGSVSLKEVDVSLSKAWTQGEYKFKDEPLSVIARQLERYYGVNIYLEEDHLKCVRYTGTFSVDQSIMDVLKIINYEQRLSYKRVGENIFITSK